MRSEKTVWLRAPPTKCQSSRHAVWLLNFQVLESETRNKAPARGALVHVRASDGAIPLGDPHDAIHICLAPHRLEDEVRHVVAAALALHDLVRPPLPLPLATQQVVDMLLVDLEEGRLHLVFPPIVGLPEVGAGGQPGPRRCQPHELVYYAERRQAASCRLSRKATAINANDRKEGRGRQPPTRPSRGSGRSSAE